MRTLGRSSIVYVIFPDASFLAIAESLDVIDMDYELRDSGNGKKLERFDAYTFVRPCASAVWQPLLDARAWEQADAEFVRKPQYQWRFCGQRPEYWTIAIDGLHFKLGCTQFGHVGVFPEYRPMWRWLEETIAGFSNKVDKPISMLNLFAHTGGATLAAAKSGAAICHLDAARGMVDRARENARLSGLANSRIRWIVDDVNTFLNREIRRQHRYDAVVIDPPGYGRGPKGQVFKINTELPKILRKCRILLGNHALFLVLISTTPGFSPVILRNVVFQLMNDIDGEITAGELMLEGKEGVFPIPCGAYCCWRAV